MKREACRGGEIILKIETLVQYVVSADLSRPSTFVGTQICWGHVIQFKR